MPSRLLALGCGLILTLASGHECDGQPTAQTTASLREIGVPTRGESQQPGDIRIAIRPEKPFIEKRYGQQIVNFDAIVKNDGQTPYRLVAIKFSVFDSQGQLEEQRELNENGHPPALDMVGERLLRPGDVIDIFQPFDQFGSAIDLSRIRIELFLMRQGHPAPPAAFTADEIVSMDVRPRNYSPAAFRLPLHGLLLIHDGHDFDSHHRRYNLAARYKADPATAVSANLYAYDFMVTTETGLLFRGDPREKRNWLSYGTPVFAPAKGLILSVVSQIPENTFSTTGDAQSPTHTSVGDPNGFGNYVTIRHADGRVSWLLHMQPGSVAVTVGENVRAGQLLGKVGFSGDSLFPHLHFNVTDAAAYPSQGVPSYFEGYMRVLGSRRVRVAMGQIDTGDLIENVKVICR